MGVKLDWDIETEKGKHKQHKEDSKQRAARYMSVFRLFLVVGVFVAILAIVVFLVLQRWEQVNQRLEQILMDTVQAEIAALRVGDLASFEARQQSATQDWFITQREVYEDYQNLKVSSNVVLSGRILSVEVDGQRGRVQVEEIIDGTPYVQTWFYWRYADGWYHVPPDYTFWGDSLEITTDDYSIRYRSIDETLANQISTALDIWLADTCNYLDCSTFPLITVDIITDPAGTVRWSDNEQNAWQMVIPSPYTGRARADSPFDTDLQIAAATLLASRIVTHQSNSVEPVLASDAVYLQETIVAWMVGRFVQVNPQTYMLSSLITTYSMDVVPNILRNLQPASTLSLLATVTGVSSIADLAVDWRDFVLWRLEVEDDLIEQGNESTWTSLYAFTDETIRNAAYQRYLNNFTATERTVLEANRTTSDAGLPQIVARVNVTRGFETGEEIIVFSLVDGTWRRTN